MSEVVKNWLESLGLGQYASAFDENAIAWSVLPKLDHELLKEMGITAIGHRIQILEAAAAIDSEEPLQEPELDQPATSGDAERRQLTVMFCDLVGSTELSQQLDPEDLREINRAYQDACKTGIDRYDGYVARYMGDGVLAYFGYPRAHEDDAERAVRAGFAVIDATTSLNDSDANRWDQLSVRVGIATGPVVVGDLIGQGASQERAVVGETPNLAARLQSLAEPNTVVISPGTRHLLGNQFAYADLGLSNLRGFKEPVRVSRVEREGLAESRFEARDSTRSRFVGRVHELGLVVDRWSMARSGEGQVVLISGEPGIGKSRLVEVLQERVMGHPHIRLRYQCSPYHTNSAFYPIIMHLERAARFKPTDSPEGKLEKLEALLAQTTDDAQDAAPLLASLLSLPGESRYGPLELTSQQLKERTLGALTSHLVALAQQQPVLFIFEDAHWVDPTTRELLVQTISGIETVPVMMVVTHRPGTLPNWADVYGHATALTLSRLGREKTRELVHSIAGDNLSEVVVKRIADRADGIPLFIEELTKSVIEAGSQVDSDIPESLQASLLARFDRLGDVKELAQIGATIGREFTHQLLASVSNRADAALEEGLERLVRSELVFRRGDPPNATYVFKHALVQDTAYSTLLEAKRRALHLETARAIELNAPDTSPEILAHHYARGSDLERATDLWIEAGRRSTERSAYSEAIVQFCSAIDALAKQPVSERRLQRELSAWVALGPAYMVDKGPSSSEVEDAYRKAAELSERLGDREQRFRSLFGQWHMNNVGGQCSKAHGIAQELLAHCRDEDVSDHHLQANHAYWSTAYARGDFAGCAEHVAFGRELYDADLHASHKSIYGGHDPGVCCYMFSAWMNCATGNAESALKSVQTCLALSEKLEHPYSSTTALWGASKTYQFLQLPTQAMDYANKGLEFAQSFGVKAWIPVLQLLQWSARGTQAQAEELPSCIVGINEARERWKGAGAGIFTPWFRYEVAKLHLRMGDPELALEHLMEALKDCEINDEHWLESEIHRLVARSMMLQAEQADTTHVHLEQALSIAESQGAKLFRLRAAKDLAQSWNDIGERERAVQILLPAYKSFSEGFETPDLKEAKAFLDQLS